VAGGAPLKNDFDFVCNHDEKLPSTPQIATRSTSATLETAKIRSRRFCSWGWLMLGLIGQLLIAICYLPRRGGLSANCCSPITRPMQVLKNSP
jgi:hypothetical protein